MNKIIFLFDWCIEYLYFIYSIYWSHGCAQCWTEHTVCPEQILMWWLCISEKCWHEHTVPRNRYWSDGCVHQRTMLNWTQGLTKHILNWLQCISQQSTELNTRSVQNKYWRDGCVHERCVHERRVLKWTHGLSRTKTEVMAVCIRAKCWTESTVYPEQILMRWLCTSQHIAVLNTRSVQNK